MKIREHSLGQGESRFVKDYGVVAVAMVMRGLPVAFGCLGSFELPPY